MFKNVNTLKMQRAELKAKAEELINAAINSGRDLNAEEIKQYNSHIEEIKQLTNHIDRHNDLSTFGAGRSEDGDYRPTPFAGARAATQANSPENWTDARTGQPVAVLKPEQRMADLTPASPDGPLSLGAYVRGIVTGRWNGAERELKAMSEGSLGSGGYLLPAPLATQIIDRVRNAAVLVRAGARTVQMDSSTLAIARVAASGGDPTAAWHAENAAITASDMTFERVTFNAQTLAALCTLSVELFEDTNISEVVGAALGKVLALELDRAGLRGSGTAPEPRGIRNQTGVTVDSATFATNGSVISASAPTGAVAWDWASKQISGLWGVNENPNAVIYSARTAGELDLLRASTGEPLAPPNSVGNLQRLFTNAIPNNLTQGTSNDCSEAYVGDFSQALIGLRQEVVLEISRTATVGSTSMFSTMGVAIRAYLRGDFQLARPGAFRVVTGIR